MRNPVYDLLDAMCLNAVIFIWCSAKTQRINLVKNAFIGPHIQQPFLSKNEMVTFRPYLLTLYHDFFLSCRPSHKRDRKSASHSFLPLFITVYSVSGHRLVRSVNEDNLIIFCFNCCLEYFICNFCCKCHNSSALFMTDLCL